jgi:ABC-2 type transport system ATP-binding protein
VDQGELFAFLGPNGAGKTTTIRMLTGLIRPTEGRATVGGLDIARHALEAKARIGVVPQRSNLYGELSARDNLVFMAQLYGLPSRTWHARADELLEQFGLQDRARSPFATLSGGTKRRLTIAAALLHKPPVLFMDEPTSGLDVESARGVRGLVADLRRTGVTIFLTTHLLAEVERLADRVAIIVKGRIVATDTPEGLRSRVKGDTVLDIRLKSVSDDLISTLRALPSLTALTRSGDSLHLVVTSVDEALEQVLHSVRAGGSAVTSISTVTPTLEEAFVQLTHLDATALQGGPSRNSLGAQA